MIGQENVNAMLDTNSAIGITVITTVEDMDLTTNGTKNANAIEDMTGNMTDVSPREAMDSMSMTFIEDDHLFTIHA